MALAAHAAHAPPRRNDDRIILHFDYDCFYAQVVQNRAPGGALVGRSVGVTQKSILATCNYEARRCGVRKLMRISEARRICPDIVLVDGEDLSPFRDVSKQLYRFMCDAVGPAAPVERLGLDEVFVDATALVNANLERLLEQSNQSRPQDALFVLSTEDDGEPHGFSYASTLFSGCVIDGNSSGGDAHKIQSLKRDELGAERHNSIRTRLLLGSQLAAHLRRRLEHEAGYTASAGIATSKLLSKLAGKVNKPANQTVIVSAAWGEGSEGDIVPGFPGSDLEPDLEAKADFVVWRFMDPLPLRSVPGIGFKTSTLLSSYILHKTAAVREGDIAGMPGAEAERLGITANEADTASNDEDVADVPTVTVEDVRTFPGMSPRMLDSILGGSKAHNHNGVGTTTTSIGNIPTGRRVWDLLHGVDDVPVRGGRDLPTQISIEDTYAGPRQGTLHPDAATAIAAELRKLATSLLRRMHVDLVESLATSDNTVPDPRKDSTGADVTTAPGHVPSVSWLARPRTLRLTLRPQMLEAVDNRAPDNYFARMSRSQPLPGFVFSLATPPEKIVDRLVAGSLIPMFRKLAASVRIEKRLTVVTAAGTPAPRDKPTWTVGLLNVCVANMAPIAGRGDDIAAMFKRQKNSTNEDLGHHSRRGSDEDAGKHVTGGYDDGSNDNDASISEGSDRKDAAWDTEEDADHDALETCAQCGHQILVFARKAHAQYHILGD